jgi:hypothetical protein
MSRRFPYRSGWCSPGGTAHARCAGAYGAPGPASHCSCACHPPAAAALTVDGQLDLLAEAVPDVV